MKKILLIMLLVSFNFLFSQVTIDETLNAQQLVQDALIGNPNFPASNFITSTGTDFDRPDNGIAAFNAGGTDLAFDQGIVLCTGNVAHVPGPNSSNTGGFWPGDTDLETMTSVSPTFDASSIQFDFVAQVASISLDFLLASEEYDGNIGGSFECEYADTFAFILTNTTTGVSQNIALIPGTSTPISIVTVHPENAYCPAINEVFFDRYNDFGTSPINFDGQTHVFTLIGDLVIGNSYSIKIVVADAVDSALNSALFIRNSSFGAFPEMEQKPDNFVVEDLDNNGSEVFNLKLDESQMLGSIDTSMYSFDFTYHHSLADAEAGINAIANPETYTNTSNPEDIFVSMRNSYTGATITNSFRIATDESLLSTSEFELSNVVLYPSPVLNELFIDSKILKIEKVEVYNLNGQLVSFQNKNETHTIKVNFSKLTRGIYIVKLISGNESIYKRIIK